MLKYSLQSAIRNPQSAIRNPQSAIRSPQSTIKPKLFVTCLALANPAWAVTYDPTADFSITNGNPNGVWSYGWMPTDFSAFNLYTLNITDDIGIYWGLGTDGGIWKNISQSTISGVLPGQMSLHPHPDTTPCVMRWTAPSSNTYHIVGEFFAGDYGTMLVAVRKGNTALWEGTDAGTFDLTTAMTANETIDFAVYGGYYSGNTPLAVTITDNSPIFLLTVTKPGTGSGTVTSAPTGINCGATCNANFATNTNVVLTAAPAVTSNFVNWSGACSGTAVTCTVAMTAAKSVTATFNLIPVITPPTAITNAASNITVNSAKLNGSVKSNGATAAVSFDFGATTTYGTSIAATPANVFSNTAVAVAATKTGLACGRTYHYRVKAVNSKGTGYGADKIFATTACRRDLIVTGVTLTPATPVANGTFNVAVTVKNAGTATSNIGFFVDVWANSTAVPGCGAEGDGWVETPMLAAGASRIVTVTGLKAGTAGTKTLRAFVDSWCEVVESNEANNQMVKAYSVQ